MRCWDWRLSVAVGVATLAWAAPGMARPVADQTLGEERSQVIDRSARDFDVQGGARRGRNLFHSFQEFGVDEGGSVYFLNPDGVENIFSRVTGANRSDILGTLGVRGGANLFLMNPNGILFGQNAKLDVQGSFVGTTANAIGFGNQGLFSASGSVVPQNLLTINPSAFLFNSPLVTPSSITVQGDGEGIRLTSTPIDTQSGLRVPDNRTLALIGGSLRFEGSTLKTAGGRIELGSVASGSVGLVPVADGWTFNYANVPTFRDIQLFQRSVIDASGLGGGNIQVRGNRITLAGESQIEASTLGSQPGGNLEVIASDTVNLSGAATQRYYSSLSAQTYSGSTGAGGNITINTNSLQLDGWAIISTNTFGSGRGGNIAIQANRGVDIDSAGVLARIETDVSGEAGARGGNLTITTPRLNMRGAQISSSVSNGNGQAGNLTVHASESADLSGEVSVNGGSPGGLFAQVGTNASGRGGDLRIDTGRLRISNGSEAQAISFGNGDSGNIFISANRVEVVETNTPQFDTGILVGTGSGVRGNGGSLTIQADQISVRGGGVISGSARGQGNASTVTLQANDSIVLSGENLANRNGAGSPGGVFAQVELGATGRGGNLRIETGRLSINNGSKVQVGTFGQGDAGDLFIRASEIDVFNTGSPRFFTGIFAGVLQDPTSRTIPRGNGGNLTIETDRLSIRDGARVSADTSGIGNGGDLSIHATGRVEVVGAVIKNDGITESPSYLGAEVFPLGVITPATPEQITGKGGNLTVRARELSIREGGRVSVSTNAAGDAGNIDIQNAQLVEVIGQFPRSSPSSLRANVGEGARGRGGEINIETVQLNVRNTGQISASTSGSGRAGSIRVQGANSITLDDGSISTAINRGSAAEQPSNINLQTRSLSLNNGSEIIASTQGQGRAGDVTVREADRVSLNRSTISTEVGTTGAGQGGNIDIRTGSLNLDNHSNVTSSTSGQGDAGTITIRGADISLSNSSLSTAITGNSTGQGGSIRIRNGNSLTLNDRAQVSASNTARGNAGNLDLQLTGNLNANNSRITTSANGENASGGAIAITADNIRLRNNSDLSTEVNRASGNGGDITLNANSVIAYDDSDIISRAGDRGGDIILNTPAFFGEGYQQNVNNSSPDGNDRVDLNANGRVSSGTIRTPNTDTIQNSLSDLPIGSIDSDRLIANSCIARTREGGTFLVTGSGGLADRPGNTTNSTYPTGEVRAVPINTETWQPGGAIVEPQGVYQLPDGRIIMSRECSEQR